MGGNGKWTWSKCFVYHTLSAQGSGIIPEEELDKLLELDMVDDYKETIFMGIQQDSCTNGLRIVTAYIRPVQVLARQNPSMEREDRHKFEPLAEELLKISQYYDRDSQFSLRIWLLLSWSHARGRSHMQEYMGLKTVLDGFRNKRGHIVG